jgi:hypothetical protein
MKPKTVYAILCMAGVVLPYGEFFPWLRANGLNLGLLLQQLFANRVSGFFGVDVLVSAVVLLAFVCYDGSRLSLLNRSLVVLALLTVGVSLGLPLFLYFRESKLQPDIPIAHARL